MRIGSRLAPAPKLVAVPKAPEVPPDMAPTEPPPIDLASKIATEESTGPRTLDNNAPPETRITTGPKLTLGGWTIERTEVGLLVRRRTAEDGEAKSVPGGAATIELGDVEAGDGLLVSIVRATSDEANPELAASPVSPEPITTPEPQPAEEGDDAHGAEPTDVPV